MELTIRPTNKQHLTYEKLFDDHTKIIGFGGGAGSGKSWLICEWQLTNAIRYPGYRGFIARNELKRLMNSTFVTFQKVCKYHKVTDIWTLDGKYNVIRFDNGSTIDLLDVAYKPTDQDFERLGSTEYTSGAIEEAGEVHFKAFDVLKSRTGRHNIFEDKNGTVELPPKMLLTFNPTRNWVYQVFYKPSQDGTLPSSYAFISALYTDNPYTAKEYGEQLDEIIDEQTKQRLKYGNWDYEDTERQLMKYTAIVDMFSNTVDLGEKYLTVDVADDGSDKTIFTCWDGFKVFKIEAFNQMNTEGIILHIRDLARDYQIPYSHIAVDAIGVGAGVASNSQLAGIIAFKGSYASIRNQDSIVELPNVKTVKPRLVSEYKNLRCQCMFELAQMVNNRKMAITNVTQEIKDFIIEELAAYRDTTSGDGKSSVSSKEDIKKVIARSPDYTDTLQMRMYFGIMTEMDTTKTPEYRFVVAEQANRFIKTRNDNSRNSSK